MYGDKPSDWMPRTAFHGIEVRHLKLVRAIVDEAGLTAGGPLHLTQSALSQHVLAASSGCGIWWSICSFVGSPNFGNPHRAHHASRCALSHTVPGLSRSG